MNQSNTSLPSTLSTIDYVSWVQRSWNRILGQTETTVGVDSETYRDLIELFQRNEDLPLARNIFPTDQNRIVQLNHADSSYMTWVRTTLQGLGLKGSSDKALVATFQNSTGLGNDGWIGAKTETAIIWTSGGSQTGERWNAGHAQRRQLRLLCN